MTIVVAELDDHQRQLSFWSDSRLSGAAATESGAKIYGLDVEIVRSTRSSPPRFPVIHRSSYGFAFSGSTLAALNTYAFTQGALQNLMGEVKDLPFALADIATFAAKVAKLHIMDVVSRSEGGLRDPKRYFFQAFLGGYCWKCRRFELFQIEPIYNNNGFDVVAVQMQLQPGKFFAVGSATNALVSLAREMEQEGFARGAYGALELLLALGEREDVGGWIQCGITTRNGFRLKPTVKPSFDEIGGPITVNLMGFDTGAVSPVGAFDVGYELQGPAYPVNWLETALPFWRAKRAKQKQL